jgi:hypothetical protein
VQGLLESDDEIAGAIALLRASNARLVGIGSIVDTRAARRRFTIKDVAAIQISHERYPAGSCPLCASGVALDAPAPESAD